MKYYTEYPTSEFTVESGSAAKADRAALQYTSAKVVYRESNEKEFIILRDHGPSSWSKLSVPAAEKLNFILASDVVSQFPEKDPDMQWVGAVIDFLELVGLK